MLADQLAKRAALIATSLGMTHDDIAQAAGMSQPGVSLLLSRTRQGRPETWDAIGKALGVAWVVSARPLAPSETDAPRGEVEDRADLREQPGWLDALQSEVGAWCIQFRDGEEPDPLADALAVTEEAGEVARAALKRWHGKRPGTDWTAELRNEAADVAITLLSLASNEGWSLAAAIRERWAGIPDRHAARLASGSGEQPT